MTLVSQPFRVPFARGLDGSEVFITREWWNYLSVELIRQISTSGVDISALEDDVTALQDESELVLTRRSDIDALSKRVAALEEQIGAAR